MAEGEIVESQNTQTQTQQSQIDWSQTSPSSIPTIWGRLYFTKLSLTGKHCWRKSDKRNPEYFDLIQPEFSLGRSLQCSFVMKKDIIREDIIKNVSKLHFTIKRDITETLSPAIITDLSYNGTFVNGVKIGKGESRILDNNDEICITHPLVKIFVFKDLLINEQDNVPKEISQKYYISRTLGQGACGVVKLIYEKIKCTRHAMKIVKKAKMTDGKIYNTSDATKIMNEINIMKALKHPLIVRTEEVFDSYEAVYIILELMEGGELFERIAKQGQLSEACAKFYFRQMVLAVKYLHSQGITHRDLKPENVLLESKDTNTRLKISDFGLSKFVGEHSFMKTVCGTAIYVAPEVLMSNGTHRYGPQVDVWSLGVILFVSLSGYLPFSREYGGMTLEQQIIRGRPRYSASHWRGITTAARGLVRRLLTVPVRSRITLDQVLQHEWMQDIDVISRVELLLRTKPSQRNISFSICLNDSEDEENNNPVVMLASKLKRNLSNSFNSSEPLPKKIKIASEGNDVNDDTNSVKSIECCEF